MLRLPTKPRTFLARPGLPTRYSVNAAAVLFNVHSDFIHRLISEGTIRAKQRARLKDWWIPRSELIRAARVLYADRPAKLASILAEPKGKVIAVTSDVTIRRHLSPYHPMYAGSPFALGQILSVQPAAIVFIDWETTGSDSARDIAARLRMCPDRPRLVGLLPESIDGASKDWDAILLRPCRREQVATVISRFRN